MANYNAKIRGVIEGLSDFWLLYFKEIDQLEVLYRGADVLLGQSYLDLMSLLLNNSVQDAPLFNKEYFKHIRIQETELKYQQRAPLGSSVYLYPAEDNLVFARALNNKIFSVTAALERGIDYDISDRDRIFAFNFDPLNAYSQRTYGTGDAAFTLRTRIPGATFSVQLLDDGTAPTTFTLNNANTEMVIAYDGPTNSATGLSRNIVASINTHPIFSGLLVATLDVTDLGNVSPAGTALLPLTVGAVSPLDGYATRIIDVSFGGQFTCTQVLDWASSTIGIKRGDILRFLTGPMVGRPIEYSIDTIRTNALYLNAAGTVDSKAGALYEFTVLREPQNNQVINEPFSSSGVITQNAVDGVLTAITKNFYSASATFSPLHKDEYIELLGSYNTGDARILAVVDANNVILAVENATDEILIPWNLYSTATGATYTDGVLVNNGDGTGTFTSASATFVASTRTVIKIYRAGAIEKYEVYQEISGTSVAIYIAPAVAAGAGLTWLWANTFPSAAVVSFPFVKQDSITITARRLLDGQAVIIDRDYSVNEDTATITPKTIWEASASITVNYLYRLIVLPASTVLQSGVDGVLTYGSPSTFTAASAAFTYADIGQAITIANSALDINKGTFYISNVTSTTTAQLTSDRIVAVTADANNGTLVWSTLRRGALATENITTGVHEIAFWAPDVLIDRFHLYNTFGYLIGKFGNSSEEYRALIRGVFQLFMLGPTLERFESAVNTIAGLPVIRDDGEILLSYTTGAYDTGTDGFLIGTSKQFTAVSGVFDATTLSDFLYISTGLNAGKAYKITQVLNSTTLVLDIAPVTEGPVSWELSIEGVQTITTSRADYTVSRTIPIKDKYTDTNNWGVLVLRAFEVITAAFTVTDYIESPTWWANITIPEELWEGEDTLRRNSTPALFENVIGASDGPRIGDPGFYIGADSQGFVPPSVFKYDDATLADGSIVGDLYYPATNNVFFTTSINTSFTQADTDSYLVVEGVDRYRILQVISSSQIKLEAFVNVANATGLAWAVYSQPVALRHKAAFVVLDTWLKHHLFYLSFDPVLLGLLDVNILADLETLVFAAKPSYTYIIVSPSSLFKEILKLNELFTTAPSLALGGSAGDLITGNATPLAIDGSWLIGTWYRYREFTGSFAAPTASVPNLMGVAPVGYNYYPTKVVIEDTFVDAAAGLPIPYATHIAIPVAGASGSNPICNTTGTVSTITVGAATFTNNHIGAHIRIAATTTPTVTNNDRDFVIGSIVSTTQVIVGEINTSGGSYTLTASTDGTWQLLSTGGVLGHVYNTADGESLFVDTTAVHPFNAGHVGTFVRFVYPGYVGNRGFRIDEYVSATQVRVAERRRTFPNVAEADELGSVTSLTLTSVTSLFSNEMGYNQRVILDPTTAKSDKYYVIFNSGVNAGERRRILNVTDAFNVDVEGAALSTDAAVQFYVEIVKAYSVIEEASTWEHIENAILISGNTLDLSNTPTQAVVATVNYTAYGIREPIDPGAEVFDASAGDSYYHLGMPHPRPEQGRSRSARDVDLHEDPIQIKVT